MWCALCYTKISRTSLNHAEGWAGWGVWDLGGQQCFNLSWHHPRHCRERVKHCCHGSLFQHSYQDEEVYNLYHMDGLAGQGYLAWHHGCVGQCNWRYKDQVSEGCVLWESGQYRNACRTAGCEFSRLSSSVWPKEQFQWGRDMTWPYHTFVGLLATSWNKLLGPLIWCQIGTCGTWCPIIRMDWWPPG